MEEYIIWGIGAYLIIGFFTACLINLFCIFFKDPDNSEEVFGIKDFLKILFCYPLAFFKRTKKFFVGEDEKVDY